MQSSKFWCIVNPITVRRIEGIPRVLPDLMFDPTQYMIFVHSQLRLQNVINSSKITQMEAVIVHLNRQKSVSYVEVAKIYELDPSTLVRRHKGITVSWIETTSTFRQCLNNTEEDTFLNYIDSLTDRHISPTTKIIKNLTEEIVKESIKKNWTVRFIQCHSNYIYSLYLQSLDRVRIFIEFIIIFQRFYILVQRLFTIFFIFY